MASARHLLAASITLLVASPALAFDQTEVGPAYLPPIARDHGAKIGSWARTFFADRNALAGAKVSAPVLIRDGMGRLLWLVCLETPNAGPDPRTRGVQRHAFGFAPKYFSAPQQRARADLTRDRCDERSLAWRPFQASERSARRR